MNECALAPFDWGDGLRIVYIPSDRIVEGLRYWRENDLDGIGISRIYGYLDASLHFLQDVPDLNGLVVSDGDMLDISPVESCVNLELLSVSRSKQRIS